MKLAICLKPLDQAALDLANGRLTSIPAPAQRWQLDRQGAEGDQTQQHMGYGNEQRMAAYALDATSAVFAQPQVLAFVDGRLHGPAAVIALQDLCGRQRGVGRGQPHPALAAPPDSQDLHGAHPPSQKRATPAGHLLPALPHLPPADRLLHPAQRELIDAVGPPIVGRSAPLPRRPRGREIIDHKVALQADYPGPVPLRHHRQEAAGAKRPIGRQDMHDPRDGWQTGNGPVAGRTAVGPRGGPC